LNELTFYQGAIMRRCFIDFALMTCCLALLAVSTSTAASGDIINLGTLGGTDSYGIAVNQAGQVVGESGTADGTTHAFLYAGILGSGGAMVDLGTLGGTESSAYAINDAGQIAGYSYLADNTTRHAFLYTGTPGVDGQMIDLDTWLDATNPTEGAKWTRMQANDLTDTGLITGYGTYDDGPGGLSDGGRAFLLDASSLLVPEPSTFALAPLGAVGLLAARRRARR
jgi:probable HAF family extracellular repeat protein